MSVQCEKIDPRQLPRGRCQETHMGNQEQMAESKAETAMGARAQGDRRKRKADTEAKRAAEEPHKNRRNEHYRLIRGIPDSKLATKQTLKARTQREYEKKFQGSPRYDKAIKYNAKAPSPNFRKISVKLSRRQVSILIQLRTGHVPLQAYLHCFKLSDTPECPTCGEEPETVTHYLKHCQSYKGQR